MCLDTVSLLILLLSWSSWEDALQATGIESTVASAFEVTMSFAVVLLAHAVLMIAVTFCQMSYRYVPLFRINLVWLAVDLIVCASYLTSPSSSEVLTSLLAYLFLRLLSHLVVAHQCYTGRVFATFRYSRFAQNWRWILASNTFVKTCPFFFEIQTLLSLIVAPTKVPFSDFMLVSDVTMRIENAIARQMRPGPIHHVHGRRRIVRGVLYLAVFLLIVFVPLFFFTSGTSDLVANPLESAVLELGVHPFPPFYRADAVIAGIDHNQNLSSHPDPAVRRFAGATDSTVFAADFPAGSAFAPLLSAAASAELMDTLDVRPFRYKLLISLSFAQPTTQSFTQTPVFLQTGPTANRSFTVHLPALLSATQKGALTPVGGAAAVLACDAAQQWTLERPYRLIVYSELTPADGIAAVVGTGSGGTFVVFYVFLVIMIGMVLREQALVGIERLWIERLDVPHRLYRMCMTILLCRDAGDAEREAALVAEFLDVLRSRERVLALTAKSDCL
jgi:hypothetical protein